MNKLIKQYCKQQFTMKIVGWSIIVTIVILAATTVFDASLQLGKFHGLVFGLYSMYGLASLTLVFLGIAAYTRKKDWLLAAGTPMLAAAILFIVSLLI